MNQPLTARQLLQILVVLIAAGLIIFIGVLVHKGQNEVEEKVKDMNTTTNLCRDYGICEGSAA